MINVRSVHQIVPKPNDLAYSVTKGRMQNLTRTLALGFGGRGIRVNAVGLTPYPDFRGPWSSE